MKNLFNSVLFLICAIYIISCDEEIPIHIADIGSESLKIQTDLASEYLLSVETKDNIADRLIWNETTLETVLDYEVQGSIDPLFSIYTVLGTTKGTTNYALLVKDLLKLATDLGLDDNPLTKDANGNPNNSGTIYLRVKASVGNEGAGAEAIYSDTKNTVVTLLEVVLIDDSCDELWLVGDALQNVGWGWSSSIETTCNAGVQTVKAYFFNGVTNGVSFRFFETFDSLDENNTYQYYVDQGYTIDTNFEGSTDTVNFVFNGADGIYTLTLDTNTKEISLLASESLWAVGDATPGGWSLTLDTATELPEITPGIWQATFVFINDNFRFFDTSSVVDDSWNMDYNYSYFEDKGFVIDSNLQNDDIAGDGNGDGNFLFTGVSGSYTITINEVEKVITLE